MVKLDTHQGNTTTELPLYQSWEKMEKTKWFSLNYFSVWDNSSWFGVPGLYLPLLLLPFETMGYSSRQLSKMDLSDLPESTSHTVASLRMRAGPHYFTSDKQNIAEHMGFHFWGWVISPVVFALLGHLLALFRWQIVMNPAAILRAPTWWGPRDKHIQRKMQTSVQK